MLELPMTAAGRRQEPTVIGKQSKNLADFHGTDYEASADLGSNRGLTLEVTGAPARDADRRSSRVTR